MNTDILFREAFRGRRVLILGGLGFLGSSLALRLVDCGATVTLADAMIEEYGGNLRNIAPVRDAAVINFCDIRDAAAMDWLVREKDYVFHSAAQVCHLKSLSDPFPDIDINIKGTAVVMEALRRFNPTAKVIKLGSRGQYGSVLQLPAGEETKPEPKGIYEISLLAAEHIMRSYHRNHGIRCVLSRLTNIYGPRAQMRHNRFGVANWFMRLAIDGDLIPIFGDGRIKRDFLYIDDCVDALLLLAVTPEAEGEVFNIGHDAPSDFLTLAETIVAQAGSGELTFTPFSPERKAQEPGDFYTDISKINRVTGWRPSTALAGGVAETIAYYRENREYYW
ncbi:NAD-dependent epimerase/dehydratase [Solidesulfovibrio fructosivorans JJ]]|uniref:NAD-dependent epimerase/dehydratase n=1 Tax=Solidesulfovibrio fructosivorans JJ] TaxID=596151 RepID=E1JXS1_SOLFR|nr:NAD-dependent epimerase/dehydratase family protein [Solidesulfovibrio fructosivorans]EFL50844.1 NAD-dependent epimerase/dehydratase [Solidesulfovibrio fructosivorans JJ]]